MCTPLCMHLQTDADDNDQYGLAAQFLVSLFPRSVFFLPHFVYQYFMFNAALN